MRSKRKQIEERFAKTFSEYFTKNFDRNATILEEITDKPDLAVLSQGRTIAVELSQFPSKYIIKNFHKKLPKPPSTRNSAAGELFIYPFEPHRWVHEVLEKKKISAQFSKKRIKASEIWLVLHGHSENRVWPMSKKTSEDSRKIEEFLMRFGTRSYGAEFDKIFYIYSDGTVVFLRDRGDNIPSKASLKDDIGYPAVTEHRVSFQVDVPLPGLGHRDYRFKHIDFQEFIVTPVDDWMSEREPNIERPDIEIMLRVTSDNMSGKLLRNGVPTDFQLVSTNLVGKELAGQTMSAFMVMEWGVQPTTFHFSQ